ncbi:MAG: aspartate--tRNA ligase [Planctomycetaceae bacterium]|jgi:aspartyl-tRNA synthetase|nr:aspartate--tRNA ligase [Phycisphaerales bacterium]MCE2653264.1 aspartate--tRNA ligase [Planctomycetaceae bacterium]
MILRTHNCGELRESHVGQTVSLNGWVNSYRDHGNLIFIDLRDRFGLTQLVFDPDDANAAGLAVAGDKHAHTGMMGLADKLRNEDVVAVTGLVRVRRGGENPKLPTGKIEIVVTSLEVLNKTENPPFLPDDNAALPNEELRLKYRYLDLRRPAMQRVLATRSRAYKVTRDYFHNNGFLEVETPILYKSTPEGAREFLVPCRNVPGNFYALPQSPQLFKQILMVANADRYMQICRCFRDEDPRADRQPEFTQIDLEMSFVRREQLMQMMEGFVRHFWKEMLGYTVPPLQRMSYRDAMEKYGIDRPDTRYDLFIHDISELAARTEFAVFRNALEKGKDRPKFNSKRGVVKAIRVPGGAEKLTRKITDGYSDFAKPFGVGGVATVKYIADPAGPKFDTGCAKFLEPLKADFVAALGLQPGDTVLFIADAYAPATKAIGELRQKVARDMGMVPPHGAQGGPWNFLWVVDFPMFEKNKETGKWIAMHHPFTAPRDDQRDLFVNAGVEDDDAIESIVSAGYDIVLNGSEIAGGSVRIHDKAVQAKVFQLLGLSPEQAKEKFSFLLEALSYGAPPHAGIAFGFDRLIMHVLGTENIRDVIAFPKTQIGQDLMTRAPSFVPDKQLADVHVKSTFDPNAQAQQPAKA